MNFKPNIESLLDALKTFGWERRDLEQELGYSENYITQQLSKGGNVRLFKALEKTLQKATSGELKKQPKQYAMVAGAATFNLSAQDAIDIYKKMAEKSEEHAKYMAMQAENHTRRVAEQAEVHAQRLEKIIIAQLTSMDKKLDGIATNSNYTMKGLQTLVDHVEAREEVALESLSRLEKKKPDALRKEADKRIVEKIQGKQKVRTTNGVDN